MNPIEWYMSYLEWLASPFISFFGSIGIFGVVLIASAFVFGIVTAVHS